MKKLTKKQMEFLEFVNDPKNRRPPSYSMIMEALGYRSKNSVFGMVAALKKKGMEVMGK